MPPYIRKCLHCEGELPKDARANRKYCSTVCLKRANRRKSLAKERAKRRSNSGKNPKVSPAIKNFRELVKFTDIEDPRVFVREVLQEAIRDNITQAVQDNLLGAGEALTGLLPRVYAGLAQDLESKDWTIRSRAQAAVLKYAFEFRDKGGKDEDLGTINVIHNMALPNTPLGHEIVVQSDELLLEAENDAREGFEKDWPVCSSCHEIKHPDAMRGHLCSSCQLAKDYRTVKHYPDKVVAIYNEKSNDPEFAPRTKHT